MPFSSRLKALTYPFAGSISAEHGVGILKKEHLHFSRSPEEISLVKGLKKMLDPKEILNPGKIFLASHTNLCKSFY